MHLQTKFAILLLFSISRILTLENKLTKVIKDFLDIQEAPLRIVGYTCSDEARRTLTKSLSSQYSIIVRNANQSKIKILDDPHQQLFILDDNCHDNHKLLYKADAENLFRAPFRWIIVSRTNEIIPKDINVPIDSQLYIISKTGENLYTIKSIYKISKSHAFIEHDIASWDGHFLHYNRLNIPKNRSDLMGSKINVSGVMPNPDTINHLTDYRDKHIDPATKHNFLLCNYLLNSFNASGNFWFNPTWGYKNETTGMYSGMVGDLQKGIAELGGTIVFLTVDRLSVMEYIAPTTKTRARFIFRSPPLSYVTNVYTLPFSKGVWHASFVLVAIISLVIFLIVKWEWRDEEFRRTMMERHNVLRPNYLDVLVLELGAICQQGSEAEPKSGAGNIATLCVFVALMFLYTSYSANIVALLQSTSDDINTVEDLLQSRIKLGVETQPYSKYYFQIATDPVRKAIYEQKIAPKGSMANFMNITTGIRKVREEFFAFHVEESNGYKLISETFQENEKCGLKSLEIWQIIDPWIAIKKSTVYKELFKVGFKRLHESGVQSREFRKLYTGKPVCQGTGSNFMSVGIIDCYYAFLIFGIGTAISLALLLVEKFVYMKRKEIKKGVLKAKQCIKHQNSF